MKHLSPRARALTSSITAGLVVFAVALTALLAYRAFEASRSQQLLTERTLRDYAGFAAFQLKSATIARMTSRNFQALDPVVRSINTSRSATPIDAERVAQLVEAERAECRCVDSVSFFYRVSFADRSIATTKSTLADAASLQRVRDTILVETPGPSRIGPAFPTAIGARSGNAPITSAYLVTIISRLGEQPYVFTHALIVGASGKPAFAYGFATRADFPVGRAVNAVLATQPVLPSTLTRGARVDSILAVTVTTASHELVYNSNPRVASLYAAADSLETRMSGLRFEVAVNPDAAGRLIIGGLPRSRLPELLATTLVSVCLLALLLYQFRRQEELVRLRDDFVSSVSHELRTPLAQIRLLAELLRMGKVPTEEQRERSLSIIDKEARRLSFLVESILSFTHTRRDKVSLVSTDVATEIEETVAGFEPLARAEGVRFSMSLTPGIIADVDRDALRQMLLNLLDNAVRYGPQGQTVKITTSAAGNLWSVAVSDEGLGVPMDERERIFAPYYRMQRDAGGAVGGTGIGLAVVRQLAARHGGRAYVASRDDNSGNGSKFVVELPVKPANVRES